MASLTHTTTDHDEIRQWVEEHDGEPATVRGTEDGQEIGVLRIDFPGGAGQDELRHVGWEEWFEAFEDADLAFVYQERKASGEESTFFRLVARDEAEEVDYDPSEDPDTGPTASGGLA